MVSRKELCVESFCRIWDGQWTNEVRNRELKVEPAISPAKSTRKLESDSLQTSFQVSDGREHRNAFLGVAWGRITASKCQC